MQYSAHAIGNGAETAQSMLEEKYNKVSQSCSVDLAPVLTCACFALDQSMSLEEAKVLVVRVLTETMEEKLSGTNVDIAVVRCVCTRYQPLIAAICISH